MSDTCKRCGRDLDGIYHRLKNVHYQSELQEKSYAEMVVCPQCYWFMAETDLYNV